MIANRVKKGEDCIKRGQTKKKHKGQEKDFLNFLYIWLQVSCYENIPPPKKKKKTKKKKETNIAKSCCM
jgi:hypothetical protein